MGCIRMRKSWWKVPLYCIIASWLCFQIETRFLAKFTLKELPDGTITVNHTRWMIMSGMVFIIVLVVGGRTFFHNMTYKELFCSSSILVALNIILGLISYKRQEGFWIYWIECSEWSSIITQILSRINRNQWINMVIAWMSPYLFVLFGKKNNLVIDNRKNK